MPKYPTTKAKTIKYDSPSGKINIGKWLPPFQKVEGGYGYMGVLAEDVGTGKLQCHICGQWFELLTTHISARHGLTSAEYSNQFGLYRSTALKSMRIRKIQSKVMLEMRKKHKKHRMKFKKGNKISGNRKGWKKPLEEQNKYGICELQVRDKILKLKDKLGKTPALTQVIDTYGGSFASLIHNRYSGYLSLLKSLGLKPGVSNFNPKYSKEYFIKKGIKALKKGKKLTGRSVLTVSESRNIYNYFSSQEVWKNHVIRQFSKIK